VDGLYQLAGIPNPERTVQIKPCVSWGLY
jgi:hypothetical protein